RSDDYSGRDEEYHSDDSLYHDEDLYDDDGLSNSNADGSHNNNFE
ncbi:hypothetical protein A2U01_0096625, partial [Trifolium medium]|nr:hypothetical protein [Trifolium medium]